MGLQKELKVTKEMQAPLVPKVMMVLKGLKGLKVTKVIKDQRAIPV